MLCILGFFFIDLKVNCKKENDVDSEKHATANCDIPEHCVYTSHILTLLCLLLHLTELVLSLKDHWRLLCSHQRSLLVLVSAAWEGKNPDLETVWQIGYCDASFIYSL